jgi:LuxR family transcriptional regulator, quorum-sensing system regulator CciR
MLFEKVQKFVDGAKRATVLDDVDELLKTITFELGFDYFALLHALRQNAAPSETVQLTSYPVDWVDQVQERAYWVDDPVFAACELADAGFEWSSIPSLLSLSARQREVLRSAAAQGLRNGFTVPIPKGGAVVALCSFATGREAPIDAASAAAAQAVGWFAFEAVRRIAVTAPPPREPAPALTSRQLDCLVLYARGKSDGVIARLLGISRKTANEHVEAAKRRYAVATRQQLLARALWHGQISFADILQSP